MQVTAKELSLYRHILFVDGWSYRIVGITKHQAEKSTSGTGLPAGAQSPATRRN
jgi:hypothetical protein